MRLAFNGALSRVFVFTVLFLALAVPLAAHAQDVPTATSTLATGIPWLDTALKILAMVGVAASIVSHFVPPTSAAGKVVSWLALNFGKALTTPKPPVVELPPRGYARLGALIFITLAGVLLIKCSLIKSEFGPTFAADELNCETSEIAPLRDALVPQAEVAISNAVSLALGGNIAGAVADAIGLLETAAKTALGDQWTAVLCAEQVAVTDYEKMHAGDGGVSDAGPVVSSFQAMTFDRPDPTFAAYAAVKAHLAAQPKHPKQ